MAFRVRYFSPLQQGSAVGLVTVETPSGVIFNDVAIHHHNGSWWAIPSRRPLLDPNGKHRQDHQARYLWAPVVDFQSCAVRDQFSDAVLSALRAARPEVFEDAALRSPSATVAAEPAKTRPTRP